MTQRLYLTVYADDDLPTEAAHIASKSLGTVENCTELSFTKHLHGTDSLKVKINRHHPDAALLVADRYVIVHSDIGPIGGGFLEEAPIDLSAAEGKGDEWMEWSGRGAISVLERANMDTTSGIGDDPIEGFWDLSNQGFFAGASNGHPIPMMKRVMDEIDTNTPSGLEMVDHSSWGYDGDTDSQVPPFLGEIVYGADVGDDALHLASEMSQLGGVVWHMSHLFVMDAYLAFGTDRQGAFGAAGKVRFEKGVNVADSIRRTVRGSVLRTHLIVGGDDRVYVTVTDPDYVSGDVVRWGFLSVPGTADTSALEDAGLAHIEARKRQTDVWSFPQHDHGDSIANGIYEPGPPGTSGVHYWVGDTVTMHTGTGAYDANGLGVPISAITWQLKTGEEANGDYWVIPQVGATFNWPSGGGANFGTTPGSQHIPCLTAPASPGTDDTVVIDLDFNDATDGRETVTDYDGNPALWPANLANWTADIGDDGQPGYVFFTLSNPTETPHLAATAGVTYRFEYSTYYAGFVRVKWYDAGDVLLDTVDLSAHTAGEVWVPRDVQATAPANTAQMEVVSGAAGRYDRMRITVLGSGSAAQNPHAGTDPCFARGDHTHPDDEHNHNTLYAPVDHGHIVEDLADVDLSTPATDGQVLVYDSTSETWVPDDQSASGSIEVAEADGAPDVSGVTRVEFDGATVTDDGGGQVTVTVTGGPGGGGGVTVLTPSSDTEIDSQTATTNYDTATTLRVGNAWGTASFTRFALFTFDISALAGKSIGVARLWLYRTDNTGAFSASVASIRKLEARKVLRAYVPAEVTWNVYSTGNAWGTAGARLVGTDVSTAHYPGISPIGDAVDQDLWHWVDLSELVRQALDASETTLRVIVGANFNGNGSNAISFASINHATAAMRPVLRVAHS